MALTFRSNGLAGGLVSAAWWNDYYNLLTGVMTDQPITISNQMTLKTGNAQFSILNGSGGTTFNVDNTGSVYVGDMIKWPLRIGEPGTANWIQFGRNTGDSIYYMQTNGTTSGFGWYVNTTKRMELKNNGTLVLTANYASTGTFATSSNIAFDNFDVAEVFECDQQYPNGTVVCPGPDGSGKLVQCSHDNCYTPMVVSYKPGLGIGENNHPEGIHYIAIAGRVNIRTAQDIGPRQMVCSDGRGGVRTLKAGEASAVVGFTLNETSVVDGHSVVGVFLRPQFVTLR